jgi:flagellar basal-body rod protein FlgG
MIQAIGSALAGLTAGQQRMDALANDTANVNTTGYRSAEHASTQGELIETGQPLDLAIEGTGAFQLQGGRTTRDGAFQLDASAQIVTSSGQSLAPPVRLPAGTDASAVRIDANGSVFVGGAQVGQVQMAGSGSIHQGALESSNVDLADTTVGQLQTRTSYAAAIKALHVQDEMWASLMELRR